MKKKLMVLACALTLVFGMTVNTMAADSPTGTKNTTASTNKSSTAPKTGESDMLIYGLAGALLMGGTAVISRKRLEEARR